MDLIDFGKIEEEYIPTLEDDDRMLGIKNKLFKLTEAERRIFLIYLDEGTYSGVAKFFGVCNATAKKYIKNIIEKLK